MGYDTSLLLRKSAIIVVVVAAVATLLDLPFAQLLHQEPLGLLGFGLFCITYSTIVPYMSRQSETRQMACVSKSNSDNSATGAPVVVRNEDLPQMLASDAFLRPTHALTVDLIHQTLLAGQGVLSPRAIFQPSEQAVQVAG